MFIDLIAVPLLFVTLGQSPDSVVVIGRQSGVSRERTAAVGALVVDELAKVGVSSGPAFVDGSACNGKRSCFVALGRKSQVHSIAVLQVAKVLDDGVVTVDFLSIDEDGERLAHADYEGALTDEKALRLQLAGFAQKVSEKRGPVVRAPPLAVVAPAEPPPGVTKAPEVPTRVELTPPPPPLVETQVPSVKQAPPTKVGTIISGSAAAAAGATGLALGLLSSSASAKLRDGTIRAGADAQALKEQAQGLATGANVAFGVAGAAAVAAVILFLVER